MGDEMTLRQFVESTWFKGLARGTMLLGIPALMSASGFVGYTLNSVQAEQLRIKGEVAEVQQTIGTRAQVNDDFQADITADVAGVKADVSGVKATMLAVQTDVATIKGILQEMQRRDVAARYLTSQ